MWTVGMRRLSTVMLKTGTWTVGTRRLSTVTLRTGTQTVGMRRLSTVTVGLVLPVRGDQIGQGIKCQLVKDC